MDLMDELKEFVMERMQDEPDTTRVILYMTSKCCDKDPRCWQCDGKGFVTDAATLMGKMKCH